MTARIVLIGQNATGLGEVLAEAIRAPHVIAPEPVGRGAADWGAADWDAVEGRAVELELSASTDGFVLEGYPRDVAQAAELDAFLDGRAASVEIALWVRSDAAPAPAEDDLLSHYRHRVVEVDLDGILPGDQDELLARALARIREATESLVG